VNRGGGNLRTLRCRRITSLTRGGKWGPRLRRERRKKENRRKHIKSQTPWGKVLGGPPFGEGIGPWKSLPTSGKKAHPRERKGREQGLLPGTSLVKRKHLPMGKNLDSRKGRIAAMMNLLQVLKAHS